MLAGGVIAWNIAIPIYSAYFLDGNPELAQAVAGASARPMRPTRFAARRSAISASAPCSIGGVYTLFSIRGSILSGIRSGLAATRANLDAAVLRTERDLPMKYVLVGIVPSRCRSPRSTT